MDVLNWISTNIGTPVFAAIVFCVVVVLSVMLLVGFFQGRPISLGPVQIGSSAKETQRIIQTGEVNLPSDSPRKQSFYDGTIKGRRTILVPVPFDIPFKRSVRVTVSLQKIDFGDTTGPNINRLLVRAENVGLKGFQVCFETWEDSKVYDAAAAWIAVGD